MKKRHAVQRGCPNADASLCVLDLLSAGTRFDYLGSPTRADRPAAGQGQVITTIHGRCFPP